MPLENFPSLNILSIGAGAIGSYVAGSLAACGHTVTLLERPHNIEVLQRDGLNITAAGQTLYAGPARCASELRTALEFGPYDVALFALKSYDTAAALETLAPHRVALPPFLCLQNGVENEAAIASMLGPARVIPGTVTTAVSRTQPGQVNVERLRGIGLAGSHPLVPQLLSAFESANLQPVHYPNPAAMKWSKLLTNLVGNATAAILDLSPAAIYNHPRLYRLEVAMLREALAVMRAHRVQVVDPPRTPARALAFAVRYLPAAFAQPLLRRAIGKGRGEKMPSFHLDLHNGRGKSEVAFLNGAVMRFGQQAGIPTPVNEFLTTTLLQLTRQPDQIAFYQRQPERLLHQLEQTS